MKNFNFYNPTDIYFGENQIDNLGKLVKKYGHRVLLTYGKGSIKKSGLYDKVLKLLSDEDITIFELGGINPNPRIDTVRKGANICKKQKIDFVLAVGGGSTIDCSKGICVGALYDGDPWDFYSYKKTPTGALPLGTVLTLSATGSEMNKGSVITNLETKQKHGWGSIYSFPKFSILDPTLTYTVSPHQTACGVVDALTHIYEYYFNKGNTAYLNDRISEAIMKTIVKYGPIALKEPNNYEARGALMWASSLALNGITKFAKDFDGFNHITEHALSAIYDITHADGLSILGPKWMEYIINNDNVDKFYEFAVNVFDIKPSKDKMDVALKGIKRVKEFYKELNMPLTLKEVGITNPDYELIASKSVSKDTLGQIVELTKSDVINILKSVA